MKKPSAATPGFGARLGLVALAEAADAIKQIMP
jgi:hypothetical protein